MSKALIVIGSSAHILSSFLPSKEYSCIILSRSQEFSTLPAKWKEFPNVKSIKVDLCEEEFDCGVLTSVIEDFDEVHLIFAAYCPTGLKCESALSEVTIGLAVNCAQPLYIMDRLSSYLENKIFNAVFISSIYAHCSPNPKNYKMDSEINPLYYGVAKAGVEQGIRWLSCRNQNHVFNSIVLGPIPKEQVIRDSPVLIKKLTEAMPSARLVKHEEVNSLVNFLLSQANGSIRGASIPLDGGYLIW